MENRDMDMGADFADPGFSGDIDIDLDFPTGRPDANMDLGDFDQMQDLENFNSDPRDELMGEVDDASYGMIDVEETDHNTSAAAANDIDIDIGVTVDNIWQQDLNGTGDFDADAEIDYLDEAIVDEANSGADVPDPVSMPHDVDVIDYAKNLPVEANETGSNGYQEPKIPSGGVESLDADLASSSVAPHSNSGDQVATAVSATHNLLGPITANPDDTAPSTITDSEGADVGQASHDGTVVNGGHDSIDANHGFEEASREEDTHSVQGGETHREPGHTLALDSTASDEDKDDDDYSELEEEHDYAGDLDTLEYRLGDEIFEEVADSTDKNAPASESTLLHDPVSRHKEISVLSPSAGYNSGSGNGTIVRASALDITGTHSAIQLADSVAMYITYGETTYSIFAKSEDDDPNQYFLSDRSSALEMSLGQFLASLREVVSEEISPLDEVVMHVDGLALEFSESTTQDFMQKFTFGDILILHDKLSRNERANSSADIYTRLSVKPSCSQRLMALVDSANAGRSLSEVALYYLDSPSVDDEMSRDAESTDSDNSGHEAGEAITYADGEDQGVADDEDTADNADEADQKYEREGGSYPVTSHEPTEPVTSGVAGIIQSVDRDDDVSALVDEAPQPLDDEIDLTTAEEDNVEGKSLAAPFQGDNQVAEHPNTDPSEITEQKPQSLVETMNGRADAVYSESTSHTATLDGDKVDEIDYSDEDEVEVGDDPTPHHGDLSMPKEASSLEVPVDDEITWESENEEAKDVTKTASPLKTVQVSPAYGKRTRSNSDAFESKGEENDVKRLRS